MRGIIRKPWILTVGVMVTGSLACSLFNNIIPSTSLGNGGDNGSGPVISNSAGVLYQDDFENPSSGWDRHAYDYGGVDYSDGKYWISSNGDGNATVGVANQSFGDVDIEVETLQAVGPTGDNNDYGIGCRVQDSWDGYYLLISGDGYYSIAILNDSGYDNLVDWQESSVIHQGNASNVIRAVCAGSSLDLYVNGEHLASANDSTFSSGDIALEATSYESDATQVYFDNLVVHQP